MKQKIKYTISGIIIFVLLVAVIGISYENRIELTKVFINKLWQSINEEWQDGNVEWVIGAGRQGEIGGGDGDGDGDGYGLGTPISGEDLQAHKGRVFCVERGGKIPYERYENATLMPSSPSTDGNIVASTGSTVVPFRGPVGLILWHTYDGPYQGVMAGDAQNSTTITHYNAAGVHKMTPTEQYVFSHKDDDLVQEMIWLMKEGGGSVIPSGGTASNIVEEGATYEHVIQNIITPSLNVGSATSSFSFTEEAFLIGPFNMNYTRYYIHGCGESEVAAKEGQGGKINFSGIIAAAIELDGEEKRLSGNNFAYPNGRVAAAAKEGDYPYPYPNEEFYIRLTREEVGDASRVTNLMFKLQNYIEGVGELTDLSGTYGVVSWQPMYRENKCYGPFEEGGWNDCGGGDRSKRQRCSHGYYGSHMYYDTVPCPCEHGYYSVHVINTNEWLAPSAYTVGHKAQELVKVSAEAAVFKTYKSVSEQLDLPLRMDQEGIVWEDSHTGKQQDQDGLLGAGEKGIEGVKVTIIGTRYGYKHETYTDADGKYAFKDVKMDQYVAYFDYDGQVWQPTTYFAGGEDEFDVNSKAQENAVERIEFNNKFKEIIEQGGVAPNGSTITSIEYDTKTTGKSFAITNGSYKDLSNKGTFKGSEGLLYAGPVEGDYEKYKMTATTMVDNTPENTIDGDYTDVHYPREDEVHIETWDKTIGNTLYTALYQKNRQINLGLVRRIAADFEIRKDVYKAIVQINGKTEEYTYSSRDNITESFDIEVKTGPDYGDVEYNRAIYRSDYNYRISDYADGTQLNKDSKSNRGNEDQVDDMISAITNAKGTNSELKIYIIYKITIANRSSLYAGTVNELVDYYDEEYTYINSWYGTPASTENTVVWTESPKFNKAKEFAGYDTLYTQTTAGLMLNSGAMIDIYMTFEVDKHTDETGKTDSIFLDENAVSGEYLGGKNNVVEINNYSTFKPGTTVEQKNTAHLVEGKIDRDSHPGNTVPTDKNTFEDDTDGAPRMNIILHQSEERSIYGYVWDDDREGNGLTLANGQIVGNGIRENGETLVNGVVVQLIEKVEIDGTTYEYIWREMESGDPNLKYLNYDGDLKEGNIYKAEDGHNYVWDSEDVNPNYSNYDGNPTGGTISAEQGYYFFDKYIPGNYIVRFIYGDNDSTIRISSLSSAAKNAISYNGQDYKSTMYRATEYTTEAGIRHYNLDQSTQDPNASKARDNAIRRIDVNKYSEQMDNHIGNVLASPYKTKDYYQITDGEYEALITELRNNTWMYADTAYINAEVAYVTDDTNQNNVSQITAPVYKVDNIGFGLEERPRTNIVLTKQIENVTITLVNGTVLVNTAEGIRNGIKVVPNKYDHSEQGKNNYLGFWSFEIDDELIQGAELKIYYRLTVDNNGQVDSVGGNYQLNTYDSAGNITAINKPSTLAEAEAWLGNAYYYGSSEGTKTVTTTIDKILDYIDRSIAFNPETENNKNVWYDVASLDDLKNAGLIDRNNVNIYPKTASEMGTSNNTMAMTTRASLPNNALEPVSTTRTSNILVLTKILGGNSAEYDYTYGNIAEIIQLTNTVGRRDPDQIPGNQDPNIINKDEETPNPLWLENDTDVAETFTITTPTGRDLSMVYYIVAGLAAAILAVGVVLIKKFVLSKK